MYPVVSEVGNFKFERNRKVNSHVLFIGLPDNAVYQLLQDKYEHVKYFCNSTEALSFLDSSTNSIQIPDVIYYDLDRNGNVGFGYFYDELIARAKRQIPLILISAVIDTMDREVYLNSGASELICSKLDKQNLTLILNNLQEVYH